MLGKIKETFSSFISLEHFERSKMLHLALGLFFVVSTYSITKPLKNTVFNHMIGASFQPWTKFISICLMFPCMLFYGFILDRLRRYKVVYLFFIMYAIGFVLLAFGLLHPVYGLINTSKSVWRIFGWSFYIFLDFFQVFIMSTFWAFSNSICSPSSAKNNYGFMVAISTCGGVLAPLASWVLIHGTGWSEVRTFPVFLVACATMLLIAAGIVKHLIKTIPGHYLHGYEAVYQIEKEKSKKKKKKRSVLEGIRLMITEPYVFGIFLLVYSYEIISAMIDYQMQILAAQSFEQNTSGLAQFYFIYTAAFQMLGVLFALIGTSSFLRFFDVRVCLLVSPLIIAGLLGGLFLWPTLGTICVVMVILRALNYGFNVPIREILYIPTIKDIKFRSKAWIDSFGRTFSKMSGASLNVISQGSIMETTVRTGCMFSFVIVAGWAIVAHLVSQKYLRTVKSGSAIGNQN